MFYAFVTRTGLLVEPDPKAFEIMKGKKCFEVDFPNEQRALQNVSNYLNTNIYSYLETSGGQSSNLYFNVVHFFNTSVSRLRQLFSCIGV